jgi:hypothetical protein
MAAAARRRRTSSECRNRLTATMLLCNNSKFAMN